MPSMASVLDQLKDVIKASDKSRYRIAQETGITQGQLSRLMSGKRGMRIETIETLADHLGLEIIVRPKRRQQRKGR